VAHNKFISYKVKIFRQMVQHMMNHPPTLKSFEKKEMLSFETLLYRLEKKLPLQTRLVKPVCL